MIVSMMMAMDRNRTIGRNGTMPWHISSELRYFKRVTMGKPVIMGRVTHQSVGRPLPGRPNIVITRNRDWKSDGVQVVLSLQAALAAARQHPADEMIVIGGASICKAAMPLVQRLYLTVIDHEFEGGDTWLDSYQQSEWQELSRENNDETASGGYRYSYLVLERVSAE